MNDNKPILNRWLALLLIASAALNAILSTVLVHYRANDMDLCAWHARHVFDDDPNEDRQRWRYVAHGELVCPFCGQLHNWKWISRNGWESQINAMIQKPELKVR